MCAQDKVRNLESMDKYTGAKTIGDGTYGSVLKAINKQNGKWILEVN